MKVKGTGSRCLLEECVKDNYYARFHPHSYHCCKEMKFIPRLDANCGRTDGRTNERTNERTNGRKVEPLYHTLLKAGAIKITTRISYKYKQVKEPSMVYFGSPSIALFNGNHTISICDQILLACCLLGSKPYIRTI